MIQYFFSPYKLLFFYGIFTTFFHCFLYLFIFLFCKKDNDYLINQLSIENFYLFFSEIKENKFLIISYITEFLCDIGYNLFRMLTNFYFMPSYLYTTNNFTDIGGWIVGLIRFDKGKEWVTNVVIKGIGYLLIIIGSFIYNEIIQLHFFGFDTYTRESIIESEKKENIFEYKGNFLVEKDRAVIEL